MNKQIKAFVSSTYEDLKDHRMYVIHALRDAGIYVDPMENWTADSQEPKQFSQERINGCDLCVLLVAFRRGCIPDGEINSITQMEYLYALNLGIDILVFLLDDDAPWPRRFDEMERDKEIKTWRDELKSKHGASFFSNESHSIKIEPAISRWLKARMSQPQDFVSNLKCWTLDQLRSSARKSSNDYLDKMQSERVYLPHLYARRIELESHLTGFLDKKCIKNGMLIIGTSGIGKTNTLCHIVNNWRDDKEKLSSDIVWMVGGSTLPGGNFSFRDVMLDRLEISETFSKFITAYESQQKKTNGRVIIIVDGVDKHPQPVELLKQLDDIVARSENYPWLKIIFSIGEVAYKALRKHELILSSRQYYTVTTKDLSGEHESVEILLGRMSVDELSEAYSKYLTEPAMTPLSSFESLSDEVKLSISNPLFLKIVMEVFNGRRIPRRVLTADVLLEYCNKKVFNNPSRQFFVNRLVDHLYNKHIMSDSFDSLCQITELRQVLLDNSSQSPYVQLLDEQVLEEQLKRVSSILPAKKTVAFTYDKLLEYLLLNRLFEQSDLSIKSIVELSAQAVNYLPLRGSLTTLILTKVDEGLYDEVVEILTTGNEDVMKNITFDVLIEYEQRIPTKKDATNESSENTPLISLVKRLLSVPSAWTNYTLIALCDKMQLMGFYGAAKFIYKSLISVIHESAEEQLMIVVLRGLGNVLYHFGDMRESLSCYEQALNMTRTMGDRFNEQSILDSIGQLYLEEGDMANSKNYFEMSLSIDRELVMNTDNSEARKGEAKSLYNLSDYYHHNGEIEKALKYAEEAKSVYKRAGDSRGLADSLDRIGKLYRRQGYLERSVHGFIESLDIYQQIGDIKGTGRVIYNIAVAYHYQGKWSDALSYEENALAIYKEIGDIFGVANASTAMGETYRQSGDQIENALNKYNIAKEIYQKLGNKRGISICLNNIGATYIFHNEAENALKYLNEAQIIQASILGIDGELETLAYLAAAELMLGRIAAALDYSDKSLVILKDRRFSEEDIQLVHYYRYMILTELGRINEANESLKIAYTDMIAQANEIKDINARNSFIVNYRIRKSIFDAWNNINMKNDTLSESIKDKKVG